MHTEQSKGRTNQQKDIIQGLQSECHRNSEQITNLGSMDFQGEQFDQDRNISELLMRISSFSSRQQKMDIGKKEISIKMEGTDKNDRFKHFGRKILQRKLMHQTNKNKQQFRKDKKETKRTIQSNQKQIDNIMSLKQFMPKIREKKKFQKDDQITQEKLEEIFLTAQQSISESESSSSGSYILVKESQLLRLKKGLLHERIMDGIIKQKTIDLKEKIFQKLEQCTYTEKNLANKQGLHSDRQEVGQRKCISECPRNVNSTLDQKSHLQLSQFKRLDILGDQNANDQQVLEGVNEQVLKVSQIPAQIEIPHSSISLKEIEYPEIEKFEKYKVRLGQQVQGLKKNIKKQMKQIQKQRKQNQSVSQSNQYQIQSDSKIEIQITHEFDYHDSLGYEIDSQKNYCDSEQ